MSQKWYIKTCCDKYSQVVTIRLTCSTLWSWKVSDESHLPQEMLCWSQQRLQWVNTHVIARWRAEWQLQSQVSYVPALFSVSIPASVYCTLQTLVHLKNRSGDWVWAQSYELIPLHRSGDWVWAQSYELIPCTGVETGCESRAVGWQWCMYHCMQLLQSVCAASVIPEWDYKATAGPLSSYSHCWYNIHAPDELSYWCSTSTWVTKPNLALSWVTRLASDLLGSRGSMWSVWKLH